jgi:hypothetical protein
MAIFENVAVGHHHTRTQSKRTPSRARMGAGDRSKFFFDIDSIKSFVCYGCGLVIGQPLRKILSLKGLRAKSSIVRT